MSSLRPGGTRFALRGVARVAYEPGEADDAKRVVLLLHPLLADRSALAAVRDALTPTSRVLLPEARGHGASASLANQWFTVAELAADVLAILDAERIARAHLLGQGLGGVTAFELARVAPDRVLSLTLVEPTLATVLDGDTDPVAIAARADGRTVNRAAADAAYKGLSDKALDTLLDPTWGRGWRDRLPRSRLAALRRHAGALAATLPALDSYHLDRTEASQITTPTLLLHRADAPPLTHLTCLRLAAWLPNARLATIPPASSDAPLTGETAAALTAHLLTFLDTTA